MVCLDRAVRVLLHGVQGQGSSSSRTRGQAGARSVVTSAGTVPAQRPGEEAPGGRQVTRRRQQDVDDLAMLVYRPVEIGPRADDLQAGLVGEPPVTGSVAAGAGSFDEFAG